jgi:hypothetical protein
MQLFGHTILIDIVSLCVFAIVHRILINVFYALLHLS